MANNQYTASNIGIRRNFDSLGDRNFEPIQTGTPVQYQAIRGLDFLGTAYNPGDTLPFDVGGTSYSDQAVKDLELFWNQGFVAPLS